MDKKQLQELKKDELIKKYIGLQTLYNDLECQYDDLNYAYDDLNYAYGDLESELCDISEQNDCLSYEISKLTQNSIIDLELFKDKLELYDLKSDRLWEFIDDYMRLYNRR